MIVVLFVFGCLTYDRRKNEAIEKSSREFLFIINNKSWMINNNRPLSESGVVGAQCGHRIPNDLDKNNNNNKS